MMPKNKNPRFAVEGMVNSNHQTNLIKLDQATQQIANCIATIIKWLLVLAGTHGLLPRHLCKHLINILGLRHK